MVDIIKNNKRTVMISLVALIAILFIMIVIINATKAGNDSRIYEDLYIKAGNPVKDGNNIYTFSGELYTKGKKYDIDRIIIHFNNCSGNKSVDLTGYVDQEIQYGELITITASTDVKLDKCSVSYEYKEKVSEEPELPDEDNTDEGNGE